MARYLINNAKPQLITVDKQKCLEWFESDGKRKIIEIAWAGRENLDGPERKELTLLKELGLEKATSQKVITYYDRDAIITPGKPLEVSSGRPLGRPKVVYADDTFTVSNYPHIIDYVCGKNAEGIATYTLPVKGSELAKKLGSDMVLVVYDCHAELLLKTFHFLVLTDEQGVSKGNKYRKAENNNPVEGNIPPNMIEFDVNHAPRKGKIENRSTLTRSDTLDNA